MPKGKPNGKRAPRERLPRERLDNNKGTENGKDSIINKRVVVNPIKAGRPGPGRPVGAKNGIPKKITEEWMEAIDRVGYDGKGRDGRVGWFMRMAEDQPVAAMAFTARLLPQRVQTSVDPQSALGQILEAARARLQYEKSRAITVQAGTVTKLT